MRAIRILGCIGCISITSLSSIGIQIAQAYESKEEVIQTARGSNSNETKNLDSALKDEYILGPGDRVKVTIYDLKDEEIIVDVLNDGTISIPYGGNIRVSGLTVNQTKSLLKEKLSGQLLNPECDISLLSSRPMRISLIGEVQRPGLYSLTKRETSTIQGSTNTLSGLPTVVDAIQKAGGITKDANIKKVILQRRIPGESLSYKQTNLNLALLIMLGQQVQNPYLFDGDIIKITKAEEDLNEHAELVSNNLSAQTISVYIIGEVYKPGVAMLPSRTPLNQAILAAGGPINWRAQKGNAELIRVNRNGSVTFKQYKVNLNQGISNELNPPLQDGDTIRINRSGLAVANDAIGAVTQPFSGIVNTVTLWQILNK